MRKIKDLRVKKSWARIARQARYSLRSPDTLKPYQSAHCGNWSGCCAALGAFAVELAFAQFFGKPGQSGQFWWPAPYRDTVETQRAYTARIIALESFALYCEEHGV